MNRSLKILAGAFAITLFFVSSTALITADQFKYMDKAGNIHFVRRASEVPKEYILQIFTPTPTPFYDKRTLAEMKRRKAMAEAERQRAEMQKQRAIRQEEMRMQQEQAREARKMRAEDDAARLKR